MHLTVKRVYERPARKDGTRVLVDRLWPRGLTKEAAAVDLWLRALAPSNELRRWFHEHREAWTLFRRRYSREVKRPEATQALQHLRVLMSRQEPVTLLFASKDLEHNNAVALKEMVKGARKPPKDPGLARAARRLAIRRRRGGWAGQLVPPSLPPRPARPEATTARPRDPARYRPLRHTPRASDRTSPRPRLLRRMLPVRDVRAVRGGSAQVQTKAG